MYAGLVLTLSSPRSFRARGIGFVLRVFDVEQAGVFADRPAVFPHQLHAIVVLGIMTGRDGNPTIGLEM